MSERVLVVEDDDELRALLVDILSDAGYASMAFGTGDSALDTLRSGEPLDVVITDLIMPNMPGDELLRHVRAIRPELNVIVVTGFGSIQSAIELIKAGAFDYVTKPFAVDELLLAVERALAESRLRRDMATARRDPSATLLPEFVGASKPIQDLRRLVARASQSRHPVLITGESGTGKELVARAIHRESGRRQFVAVNCGALPETLLESELFGHEKGAFTGADKRRVGLLESADRGTVFLDEIGELPLTLQPKLLRALEEREVRRVGATESRTLDFRIVAATNRDLEEQVRAGRFREDLFWRLNVLNVQVPALRDRSSDISLLVEYFLARAVDDQPDAPRTISPEALTLLTAYPWPGNVRELRNAIHQAMVLSSTGEIRATDLPPRIHHAGWREDRSGEDSSRRLSLKEVERTYILEVLRQAGGNKSRAADILGLDRKTLYRKLVEYRAEDSGS